MFRGIKKKIPSTPVRNDTKIKRQVLCSVCNLVPCNLCWTDHLLK